MSDPRFEPGPPLSEMEIKKIEDAIGRQLPKDYREFVKEYGGAFVGGLVDGSEDLPIRTFFGADGRKGVIHKLDAYRDLIDDGVLPIADCVLGNLWVLDRGNAVHYINYYGGRTTSQRIAGCFQDFLDRVVIADG